MRVSETSLQLHTEHPETLPETTQRQNMSRGLTNISDELYKFFIDLSNRNFLTNSSYISSIAHILSTVSDSKQSTVDSE
jgi:hypothetical protein